MATANANMCNEDAEKAYCEAVVSVPDYLDKYPLSPSEMANWETAAILRIVLELREAGKQIGILEVLTEATRQDARLTAQALLWNVLPTPVVSTQRTIRELATARRISAAMAKAIESCESLRIDEATAIISDTLEEITRKSQVKTETSYQSALRIFEQMAAGKPPRLVPTGISKIDSAIGGLGPGSITFLGADTGVGKSSTMLFMADAMSRAGFRPGLVTCEDGPDVLGTRIISLYSGVDGLKIRRGDYRGCFEDVVSGMERIRKSPISIAYEIGSTDVEVVQAMTSLVRDSGANVLFCDYAQTINSSEKQQDRRNELRRICSRLKQCAARLGVPLIVGSQLSMGDVSDGKPKVPNKHMLKESRDLANMADFVILLWRESNDVGADVSGKLDKSKCGLEGTRFRLRRDASGTLREVDDRL